MLRKFGVQFLGLGLILLVTGSYAVMAQRRISFARGRTSTTVSGSLNAGGRATFAVRCFSGQLITAHVRSSGRVFFESPDPNMYSEMTNHNGDYYITIFSRGGAARYSMTVSIR